MFNSLRVFKEESAEGTGGGIRGENREQHFSGPFTNGDPELQYTGLKGKRDPKGEILGKQAFFFGFPIMYPRLRNSRI